MNEPTPTPAGDWKSKALGMFDGLHRETKMALLSTALVCAVLYLGVTRAVPAIKEGYKEVAVELKAAMERSSESYDKDQERDAELIKSLLRGSSRSVGFVPHDESELIPAN